jgi:heme/copper-type cytochrome/quinol oxidase subunit 1
LKGVSKPFMNEDDHNKHGEQTGQPWFGKLFAGMMIAFFIMVALGLYGIYRHQSGIPNPEPVPFMHPSQPSQ